MVVVESPNPTKEMAMPLKECKIGPAAAVSDIDRAASFYEDVLGLEPQEMPPGMPADGMRIYGCGENTALFVYVSAENAGTNKATLAGFETPDFDATHAELKDRGVAFERYDSDEMKTGEDGVMDAGELKVAFFKDPDGNIYSING
jgi:catechol 2,3-dioxygenase-like lactoylglutathione lyase family enzyme